MHEIYCLGSDGVTREFHLTLQIYVRNETVGKIVTQYFTENGRRIPFIGQISVNRSAKLLGIPTDAWRCVFPFLDNVLGPTVPHGREDNDTSNQNWTVIPGGAYNNVSVMWSGAVPVCPAYAPRSSENARAAARRIHDDYLRSRHHERMRSPSTSINSIQNPMVNRRGDDREGLVDQ